MLASIIETCKLNKFEPHAYLTGVLKVIAQLLPWNFGK
jgi:transposase